jgi:hypothetical protein
MNFRSVTFSLNSSGDRIPEQQHALCGSAEVVAAASFLSGRSGCDGVYG